MIILLDLKLMLKKNVIKMPFMWKILFNSVRNCKETYEKNEIITLKSHLKQDNVAPHPHPTLSRFN